MKAAVERNLGGTLDIDEAYSLVQDGTVFKDAYGREAVDTLTAETENNWEHLIVSLAAYEAEIPFPQRRQTLGSRRKSSHILVAVLLCFP